MHYLAYILISLLLLIGESRTVVVYNVCPHEDPSGTEETFVTATIDSGSTPTAATISVSINEDFLGSGPFTPGQVVTRSFCVWLGLGVGPLATPLNRDNYYGFREAKFNLEWTFAESFTLTSFTTQAYDPVTQTVRRTITAEATICGIGGSTFKVGESICVMICPAGGETEFMISDVTKMAIRDMNDVNFPNTSPAPGGCIQNAASNIVDAIASIVFAIVSWHMPSSFFETDDHYARY